jgi:hypothetical protein
VFTDFAFLSGTTGGVSNCDSTTDWSGSPTLDTSTYIEGTGALSAKVSKATYISVFSLASPIDITNKQIIVWAFMSQIRNLDTKANGGFRIRVEDAAGNYGEWFVAGKDTWSGGWTPFTAHGAYPFNASSATPPDRTAITKIGIVYKVPGSSTVINCWWDALRVGTYIGVKGGTSDSPATLADILAAEDTYKYGCVFKSEGVYMFQSKLAIGSTVSGESTYFKDTNQVVIFTDRPVPTDYYEVLVQGNTGAETKVYFGTKVAGTGISGLVFRAAGAPKFKFTATDENITDLGVYGCSFFDAYWVKLPTYSITREVLNTNIEASGLVYVSTCTMKYCNFINADDAGIIVESTTLNVTSSNFISCPYGVRLTVTGTIVFDALKFYGNTTDIDNTSGGAVTVNCVNGSNPVTYTGNTTIVNTVYVTINVVDPSVSPIQGAQVWVYNLTDGVVIMNTATDQNGKAQTTVNYTGDKSLQVNVRKSTPPAARYLPSTTYGTLTSTGFTTTVTLYPDTVAS